MGIILALKLQKGERLSLLELKNARLVVVFSGVRKGKEGRIKKVLKLKKIVFKDSFKADNWHLEIVL